MPAEAAETGTATRIVDPLALLRYLDVVLLVLAAPFVVLLGAPALGFAVGAGGWLLQRGLGAALERWAARQADYKAQIGLGLASVLGRAWLTGLTILAVGLLAEREDGLAAGLTVLAVFSVYFATALILRPLERSSRP